MKEVVLSVFALTDWFMVLSISGVCNDRRLVQVCSREYAGCVLCNTGGVIILVVRLFRGAVLPMETDQLLKFQRRKKEDPAKFRT